MPLVAPVVDEDAVDDRDTNAHHEDSHVLPSVFAGGKDDGGSAGGGMGDPEPFVRYKVRERKMWKKAKENVIK